jgi:hypothetical protein
LFEGNIVAGELRGRGESCESVPDSGTPQQRILAWSDLMQTCEQFLLAGLRREIGPDGDLQAAHRQWYAQQMDEHDRTMAHLVERFARCEDPNVF